MVSSSSSASHKYEGSVEVSKVVEVVKDVGLITCGRMENRQGAILLIGRRRSGCFPWRCCHGRSAGQGTGGIGKRRGKQRRETGEGQTRRDGQRTDNQTLTMDGMKME